MAQLVGVLETSHGPLTYWPPERWVDRQSGRSFRADVPKETMESRVAKAERVLSIVCAASVRIGLSKDFTGGR